MGLNIVHRTQVDETATSGINGAGELYRMTESGWTGLMRDSRLLGRGRGQLTSSKLSLIFHHVNHRRLNLINSASIAVAADHCAAP